MEVTWENIKKAYTEIAEKVIGFRKKNDKEWLTAGTWKKIEERKEAKTIIHQVPKVARTCTGGSLQGQG